MELMQRDGKRSMLTSNSILATLEKHQDRIRGYGVRRIGLFGSYVNGKQGRSSDIDLLVEFEHDKKTFDNYMDLRFFLEDLFGCKVDLVVSEAVRPELRPHIMGSVRYASGI